MIGVLALPWFSYMLKAVGAVLIAAGFVALVTPFTPGAWLIPLGIAVIIGKPRTLAWSIRIFGQNWHDRLRVERILHFFIREKK